MTSNGIPLLSSKKIISFPRLGRLKDQFRSQARSLDIDQDLIDFVLAQYGLELVGRSRNLPNARRNTNLIIETTSGRKVLKNYRTDWNQSTIEFEHSILQKLADVEFPAPRLLSTQSGSTWIIKDGHNYCLFDFIPGKNYSSSFLFRSHRLQMMATAGHTLAALHLQLVGFQPVGQHHQGFKSLDQERIRNKFWNERKIEELVRCSQNISEPEDKPHADWLVGKSHEILQNLVNLEKALEQEGLSRLIIHGDYGLHNLIYTDLDHAIPVDFELARIEWRMSELVSIISKFRFKDGNFDFESMIQFLHAYQKEFPISEHEWEVFPFIWKYYKMMKAVQYWISYFETNGPVRKLHSSREEINFSEWALNNPDRITEFKEVRI